ncbi:MAG: hypothetical protein RR424_02515 [Oscillospiraceae bacterium]
MKKAISLICALAMMSVMSISAFAATAGNATSGNNDSLPSGDIGETVETDKLNKVTANDVQNAPEKVINNLANVLTEFKTSNKPTQKVIEANLITFYNNFEEVFKKSNAIHVAAPINTSAKVSSISAKGLAFAASKNGAPVKNASVSLEVKDVAKSEVKSSITALNSYVIDLSLMVKVGGTTTKEQLASPVVVTMQLPSDMYVKADEAIIIEHFIEGGSENIYPTLIKDADGIVKSISFTAPSFSYFSINKVAVEEASAGGSGYSALPPTSYGANGAAMALVVAMSAVLAGSAMLYSKKDSRK